MSALGACPDVRRATVLLIARVRIDGGTQVRADVDPTTVTTYAEDMIAGAVFPPIVVFHDGQDHWLADGFQRVAASKQAGILDIAATIHSGTRRDAVLFACGANADHGLRRTNEDKRRAVEVLLRDPEWARWSDREIGRMCKVDHKVVSRLRTSGAQPQIDQTRIVERNGKAYEQRTARNSTMPHGLPVTPTRGTTARVADDGPLDVEDEAARPIPAGMYSEIFAMVLRSCSDGADSKHAASKYLLSEVFVMLDEAVGCWEQHGIGDAASFYTHLSVFLGAKGGPA